MVRLRQLWVQVEDDAVAIRRRSTRLMAAVALAAMAALPVRADNARFDLVGPKVEVRVTRAGVTLPIASVPNLQAGDRLWLHPDLPPTQSVHYLMVLAFLRGTTNPPPENWFVRIETWDKKVRAEGVEVTVPDEAQQAVLFLAPVTGGDFSTLRSAVQGRPGIFVRASQDLAAAGFEQARIEKYIASMRELTPEQEADPKQLQDHSNRIAATLALKPNADCAKLAPDQQYTCLTQTGGQSLLDDGHGQTIVDALTGGASAGLIGTVSSTQMAGGGLYSAYVGSIVDVVHIMGSLHTAQYQYIPAIAFPQQQSLNLRLNTPPSFHNPKSVIVIGLPAIQQTVPPPLRAADPKQVECLQKPGVVLPVEGAPLVFSTGFAHDLVLHLNYPAALKGEVQDIAVNADAFRGGLVLTTLPKRHALPMPADDDKASPGAAGGTTAAATQPAAKADAPSPADAEFPGAELTGTVKGLWGFDAFTGPTMPLEETSGKDWKLVGDEPVIVGRNQHILIGASGTACVESIALEPSTGKQENVPWKSADKPNEIDAELNVPAHDAAALHLAIKQFGEEKPAIVSLVSYSPPAKLEGLEFHAGDTTALLTGTGLEQVRKVELGGSTFKPASEASDSAVPADGKAQLHLALEPNAKPLKLAAGEDAAAHVALNDGRVLPLAVTVGAARPNVSLISKADVLPADAPETGFNIRIPTDDDLPTNDRLVFSLKSARPFPRAGKVEVESPDDSLHATFSLADTNSSLILESPDTLLATLEPLKAFGPSAFGPVRARAVAPDGTAGDWLPLVTLVRLPAFTRLSCPVAASAADPVATAIPAAGATDATPAAPSPAASCRLSGTGLYFIDSISTDETFSHPTRVPEGFVGRSIAVPPPTGAVYYLRLRDDPATVDTVTLPAGPL
jgi:hypothetical protein